MISDRKNFNSIQSDSASGGCGCNNNSTIQEDDYLTLVSDLLQFEPLTCKSIPLIMPYLKEMKGKTCDFTIGGIYMWIDYFKYKYCIVNDTLFIIGREEDDVSKVAFSVPVGAMPLSHSVHLIRQYCINKGFPMVFSAVPSEYIDEFKALNPRSITNLPHWSDYLYSAQQLATFSGKKFSKKRNHVNKFNSLYPQAVTFPITADNLDKVLQFYISLAPKLKDEPMARYEYQQVGKILNNLSCYHFISMALAVDDKIISFMLGEVINDTFYAHIEKTDHNYDGASEYINNKLINDVISRYPNLLYENREDDAGDAGLRKSKLSYNPIEILDKYNILF